MEVVRALMKSLSWLFLFGVVAVAGVARAEDKAFPPEVPDPDAVSAYRQYWGAFDAYEQGLQREGAQRYQEQWSRLKQEFDRDQRKISDEQLVALRAAAKKYQKHLQEFPEANNRPFVLLNLAQILNLIGDHMLKQDASAGGFSKSEALSVLRDIEQNYRDFTHREDALYLRAIILESMNRKDEALAAWRTLANNGSTTLFAVHANLAVGDHAFDAGDAGRSLTYYERARNLLASIRADDAEYERLRVQYRIAWAAYKSANLDKVIEAGADLLTPFSAESSAEKRLKMQQDAVELIGDALFEGNKFEVARETLRRKELLQFAPSIGLRTLQRYSSNAIYQEAIRIGEFVAEEFPAARELPDVLQMTAAAYQAQKQTAKQIQTLERAALLLPAQSLWRSKFSEDFQAVKRMEDVARSSARLVAAHYYDFGLASGNLKAFGAASSYYETLIDHEPNGSDSNQWRLRVANCAYFSGNLDEANARYSELKTQFKLDRVTLEVASYQEVLTAEKRWRAAFEAAVMKSIDPIKDEATLAALNGLEKSIDEFANRFPTQSRSVDLLLVGASANRDQERYDFAAKFWQRALVSGPTNSQRAIAIRGLVFANMKTGSPSDVIASAGKFLKLEDWQRLGLSLGTELKGVLSAATLDEGDRLNKDGKVFEAGSLMVSIARDFPEVPQRDRIFRDGAYMLAIAGYWAESQAAAEDYLKTKLAASRGDMIYLLARSHEFQIRLKEAADRYLELAQKFPKHSRAMSGLDRAEKLAVAEGDFKLASEAAGLVGERAATHAERAAALKRAIEYSEKAEQPEKAVTFAQRRLDASKSLAQKFESQLILARTNFAAGKEQLAIDDLEILAKRVDQQERQLGDKYRDLAAEANFLLGEEARRRFDDFSIFERSGGVAEKVAEKLVMFEDLVKRYDKAASVSVPAFSPRARFRLGEAAESLADEVASVPVRGEQTITLKSQARYNDTMKRLRDLAKRYYSANVLAQRREPSVYRDNDWVKRSAIKLSSFGDRSPESKLTDQLPASVHTDLPYQWSL